MTEELERFEKLKKEAMETIDTITPSKKKKGCTSCKKKKEPVKQLPDLTIIEEITPFTDADLIEAYNLMNGSIKGQDLEKVKAIYKYIFNEDMDITCGACGGRYYNRFKHHLKNVMKLDIK